MAEFHCFSVKMTRVIVHWKIRTCSRSTCSSANVAWECYGVFFGGSRLVRSVRIVQLSEEELCRLENQRFA